MNILSCRLIQVFLGLSILLGQPASALDQSLLSKERIGVLTTTGTLGVEIDAITFGYSMPLIYRSSYQRDQGFGQGWCLAPEVELKTSGWLIHHACESEALVMQPTAETTKKLQRLSIKNGQELANKMAGPQAKEVLNFVGRQPCAGCANADVTLTLSSNGMIWTGMGEIQRFDLQGRVREVADIDIVTGKEATRYTMEYLSKYNRNLLVNAENQRIDKWEMTLDDEGHVRGIESSGLKKYRTGKLRALGFTKGNLVMFGNGALVNYKMEYSPDGRLTLFQPIYLADTKDWVAMTGNIKNQGTVDILFDGKGRVATLSGKDCTSNYDYVENDGYIALTKVERECSKNKELRAYKHVWIKENGTYRLADTDDPFGVFWLGRDFRDMSLTEIGERVVKQGIWGNDPPSQTKLGMMFFNGRGAPQNIRLALNYLTLASKNGQADATYFLGSMYLKGDKVKKDIESGMKLLTKAAEGGDPRIQIRYASGLETGRDGLQVNLKEAVKWYKVAASTGNAMAQCELGIVFYRIKDTSITSSIATNDAEVMQWFQSGAERYEPRCMAVYAAYLWDGIHIAKDVSAAYAWMGLAVIAGNADAPDAIKTMKAYLSPEQMKKGAEIYSTLRIKFNQSLHE